MAETSGNADHLDFRLCFPLHSFYRIPLLVPSSAVFNGAVQLLNIHPRKVQISESIGSKKLKGSKFLVPANKLNGGSATYIPSLHTLLIPNITLLHILTWKRHRRPWRRYQEISSCTGSQRFFIRLLPVLGADLSLAHTRWHHIPLFHKDSYGSSKFQKKNLDSCLFYQLSKRFFLDSELLSTLSSPRWFSTSCVLCKWLYLCFI